MTGWPPLAWPLLDPKRCGRGGLTMSAANLWEGQCWVGDGGSLATGYVAPFSPPASMEVQRSRSQTAARVQPQTTGLEAAPTCEYRAGQGRGLPAACSPPATLELPPSRLFSAQPPVGLSGSGLCSAGDKRGLGSLHGPGGGRDSQTALWGALPSPYLKINLCLSSRHRKLKSTVSAACQFKSRESNKP